MKKKLMISLLALASLGAGAQNLQRETTDTCTAT